MWRRTIGTTLAFMKRVVQSMALRVPRLLLGVGSLATLVIIAGLIVVSALSTPLAGYEGAAVAGTGLLVLTLATVVLGWARFVQVSRRSRPRRTPTRAARS